VPQTEPVLEDWGQLITFQPKLILKPTNIQELKEVLERIQAGGLGNGQVRVLGSLHSCAKIVVDDSILDTSGMPKEIEVSANGEEVTATANVRLHDFLETLDSHGKSLTATGGTDEQTLAGLISTATAPATPKDSLYDLLQWVELVTVDPGNGKVVERRISRNDAEFAALLPSLGLLGVLTRVNFSLVEERYFDVVQKIVPLEEVLADLDATSRRYDFWRVNWMQKSDKALLWAANEVPREKSEPEGDYPADQSEQILDFVFKVLDKLGDTGPLLSAPLEVLYEVLALTYGESKATGPLRNMLPVDRRAPLHVAMAEWAFRPDEVQKVVSICRDYFEKAGWPNIPTEIELTPVREGLMSPWSWDDLPYIVKFNFMYLTEVCTKPGEKEAIYTHLKGLWERLETEKVPFKAHWGKINFIDPAYVQRNHQFDAFKPLVSPIFMNEYLKERLGPIAEQP
jgi:FAD/FMN-containing dehydrogenase